MTLAEKLELTLIPELGGLCWISAAWLPPSVAVGRLLMWAAALLLAQGLLRDLWLLSRADQQRRREDESTDADAGNSVARCLCLESTLGILTILLGILLSGSTLDISLAMTASSWSGLVVATLSLGFLLRDWVIEGKPWRIRQERGHANLIVKW